MRLSAFVWKTTLEHEDVVCLGKQTILHLSSTHPQIIIYEVARNIQVAAKEELTDNRMNTACDRAIKTRVMLAVGHAMQRVKEPVCSIYFFSLSKGRLGSQEPKNCVLSCV